MPKAKLTPAQKAEKKRQKKLDAIEKKKQLKRDQLGREVKYSTGTIRKYERDWRDMLKKVAAPRMRQELEFAWHNFERVIDAKDFQISLLMDELKAAEEQYMRNFRAHLDNLDRLLNMFEERSNELLRDFNKTTKRMFDENNKEIENLHGNASSGTDYLKTMLHHLELDRKEQERTCRVEYFAKLDEVDVKNQLAVQRLRIELEKKFQQIFDKTTDFIKDYHKHIRERKKEYLNLKNQEDSMNILIQQQFRKMWSLQEAIRLQRMKFRDMRQHEDHCLADKKSERQFFYNTYATLRIRMDDYQKFDTLQLIRLNGNCNTTLEYFSMVMTKGELLLTIAAICRKLETLKEKILPFPLPTKDYMLSKWREEMEYGDMVGVKKELEMFWQRVGQVFGSIYALEHEKAWLQEENAKYERKYASYVDRMRHPEGVPKDKRVGKKGGTYVPHVDAVSQLKKYEVFKTGKLN